MIQQKNNYQMNLLYNIIIKVMSIIVGYNCINVLFINPSHNRNNNSVLFYNVTYIIGDGRKMKKAKKITSILIIASMSMVMFAGCSATKATTTNSSTTKTTKAQTIKFNPTATKTLYTDTLKTLVTAKTITQAQSDKILVAVTTNAPKGTSTGKTKAATKPSGTRTKNNKLATLVKSGVITQAQADTINTKISEAMKTSGSKQSN
jgi:hypothetical protein